MWQAWTTALLGVAVIATPFLGLSGDTFTWTLVAIGIAITTLALWDGAAEQQLERRLRHQ